MIKKVGYIANQSNIKSQTHLKYPVAKGAMDDDGFICKVDYNFSGLRSKHARSVMKNNTTQPYNLSNNTISRNNILLPLKKHHTSENPNNAILLNRIQTLKHVATGPTPHSYSPYDLKEAGKGIKISSSPLLKCDFFYPCHPNKFNQE